MNAHTRRHLIGTLIIVALLAGPPTVGTAQTEDPNTLWDASDLFAATWGSATLSVTTYNPSEHPDMAPQARKRVITVDGNVYPLDVNDLVALSTTHVTALRAFDQDAIEVLFDPNAVEQSPGRTWILGDKPSGFSLPIHLAPDQPCPSSLSELNFTVDALYGKPFVTLDLPVESTEEWIEAAPGFRVRVEEVNTVDDVCHIVVKGSITDVSGSGSYSFDPNAVWEEHVSRQGDVHKTSDLDVIYRVEIIDVGETPSWNGARKSGSSRSAEGGRELTYDYILRNCTGTENMLIRLNVVMYPYEIPIPLTLTEIPVPGL